MRSYLRGSQIYVMIPPSAFSILRECSHRPKHHSGGGHFWAMTLLVQTSESIITKDILIKKWYTKVLAYLF